MLPKSRLVFIQNIIFVQKFLCLVVDYSFNYLGKQREKGNMPVIFWLCFNCEPANLTVFTWLCVKDYCFITKIFDKGPVKLIQWEKIAHSFLQSVSNQFCFII